MSNGHSHTASLSQNHKAQLASAYNELGKELASQKVKVVGNYTLGKVIGEGTYGTVRMGVHRLTGIRVAIKQIPKSVSATLTREIHHHRQLHHPHVTQLYEVIATESHIWLVTELCSGGELFDYLLEKGRVSEAETRIVFGQLCLAVAYIHDKGVLHRDLKLENVLLDERCRVKLGDFGFTREFERGTLLDTFCGTTGYAAPEMLQGKKYLGPEVDIWSLGIILYTLLTGTLPFDDDDDEVMRQKIIKGAYEDPEWLSDECRDLIKRTLQIDPLQRSSIAEILSHPWFSVRGSPSPVAGPPTTGTSSPIILEKISLPTTSEASFHSASPEYHPLSPTSTTPNERPEEGPTSARTSPDFSMINQNPSEGTIKKPTCSRSKGGTSPAGNILDGDLFISPNIDTPQTDQGRQNQSSKEPPAYPTRTPARTKRRSVSSALSDHEDTVIPTPDLPIQYQDFSSLLNTPAPVIFSTPLERRLLNSLNSLGFDTGQIVHSVLSDACDASGSLWWMLKKKTEQAELEQVRSSKTDDLKSDNRVDKKREKSSHPEAVSKDLHLEPISSARNVTRSAPELSFIPATPTAPSTAVSTTPPRPRSSGHPLLSPPSSADSHNNSLQSTPGGNVSGSKGRKGRSGSVGIMQRATTALEAAGLVRKKSIEVARDDKERDKEKERDRDKGRDLEKKSVSGDESRTSQASSSKHPKSPHVKPDVGAPSTHTAYYELDASQLSSPWVMTKSSKHTASKSFSPTPANSPPDTITALPNADGSKPGHAGRNRASLLSAFRMWFHDDRKGKRKEIHQGHAFAHTPTRAPSVSRTRGTIKRRSSSGSKRNSGHYRAPHPSSHRSSSLNSRRSSVASVVVLDNMYQPEHTITMSRQRSDPNRSFDAHTPNSDRGDYGSRPSSVMSASIQRHRNSPSQSSAGSLHGRATSPVSKFHRREGSGSSTRVVRQIQSSHRAKVHVRSNSTASSVHSLSSSRRNSFYEQSETEGQRVDSPLRTYGVQFEDTPRRPPHGAATFIAQKRQTPFTSPSATSSYGRSSWKKSWGAEPPGWQSRSTQSTTTIEVLSISPAADNPASIRDVFSRRPSLSLTYGDESDWVDEDDDATGYAGGLGQLSVSATSSSFMSGPSPLSSATTPESPFVSNPPSPIVLSFPKGISGRSTKKGRNAQFSAGGTKGRSKAGQSPVGRHSPLPLDSFTEVSDNRTTRRQLPSGRSNGPSFKAHAIQEEDEGEEE